MSRRTKPRGSHPVQRLTAARVRHLRTPGRYADGNGLYLVVDPSGAKRWIWRGRVQRKSCALGLGSVRLVPLVEARAEALACKRTAWKGGNPRLDRQRARRIVPTFKQAATSVHAEHKKTFRNAAHSAQWLGDLDRHVFPVIGARAIDTLDTSDVLKVLTPVWMTTPATARRIKQRLKVIFDWAKASGFRTGDNPTEGLTKVLPKHTASAEHHAALPYQQVPSFVQSLRAETTLHLPVRLAFELLILTALRTSEVRLACWPEVDLDARTWTIPGERMKSSREHRVPLSDRAIEIFREARALTTGDGWIFPGTRAGQPLSDLSFYRAIRVLTDASITTHGFRSSFRDWSAERTSLPREVCEAALAHVVKDRTEAAYLRTTLLERRRDLMHLWGSFATSTPATVVAISR